MWKEGPLCFVFCAWCFAASVSKFCSLKRSNYLKLKGEGEMWMDGSVSKGRKGRGRAGCCSDVCVPIWMKFSFSRRYNS